MHNITDTIKVDSTLRLTLAVLSELVGLKQEAIPIDFCNRSEFETTTDEIENPYDVHSDSSMKMLFGS